SDWVSKDYTIHRLGRVWHIRGARPAPRQSPGDEPSALRSPDRAIREAAARRLAKDESGRQKLAGAQRTDADPRARAGAIEALASTKPELAAGSADDPRDEVRALAIRLGDYAGKPLVGREYETQPPTVRAEALRRVAHVPEEGEKYLLETLESTDPFLRQSAREALRKSLTVSRLLELARSADRKVSPNRRTELLVILRATGD